MRYLFAAVLTLLVSPAFAFDLEGHRGTRGHMPENTLPAFAKALSIGVTTLEMDIAVTADDALVIAHDRSLNADITRGPDGAYLTKPTPTLRSLTLAQVKQFDVGAIRPDTKYASQFPEQQAIPGTRMPLFSEVVALVRKAHNDTVRFNVETKLSPLAPSEALDPETYATKIVNALRAEGIAKRSSVESFDWRTLQVVQRIAPEIETVYLTQDRSVHKISQPHSPWTAGFDITQYGGSVPRMVKAAGGKIWSPLYHDLTPEALAEAKSLGLRVVVWTVNDPADMARLIDMGVDGIISDYPDRVRTVMAEKGMALPPATLVEP